MAVNMLSKMAANMGKRPDEAGIYWSGGPLEVGARTWFASLFSSVTAFETDAGVVLIDSGLKDLSPTLANLVRSKTGAPIHTCVYTHGHVDHAYGLQAFLLDGQGAPEIIAHEAMPGRFERYARTVGHNQAINARQFGGKVDDDNPLLKSWHPPSHMPTTLYRDRLDIEVGGVTFEIHHSRGETDDHSFIYCPEREVLCSGDLFIWAAPNAGNPQKVQRYPEDWARALRTMAALGARTLCPGHGGPIIDDPEQIAHMLTTTAEYLEAIIARTLEALNNDSPPHVDIVRGVELPESDALWLQCVYDDAEFIVRSLIRQYGGWWSGRPSDLKPPPRQAVATELAALAGGAHALLARAQALAAAGDAALACSLADYALEASPGDAAIQEGVAAIYTARAEASQGLIESNLYTSAAAYAKAGRAFS